LRLILEGISRTPDSRFTDEIIEQRREGLPLRLALENLAEGFKVRVAPPDGRVLDSERRDVGLGRRFLFVSSFLDLADGLEADLGGNIPNAR
jgi:hypothetical protein